MCTNMPFKITQKTGTCELCPSLLCPSIGDGTETRSRSTNKDIMLGCTTTGKIELSALVGYRIVVYASSYNTQLLGTLAGK